MLLLLLLLVLVSVLFLITLWITGADFKKVVVLVLLLLLVPLLVVVVVVLQCMYVENGNWSAVTLFIQHPTRLKFSHSASPMWSKPVEAPCLATGNKVVTNFLERQGSWELRSYHGQVKLKMKIYPWRCRGINRRIPLKNGWFLVSPQSREFWCSGGAAQGAMLREKQRCTKWSTPYGLESKCRCLGRSW